MNITLLVAAVSSFLLPPEGNRFAEPFEVVRDGKAVADIVIPNEEKNVPCVRKGAEELQRQIEAITGVKLRITDDWGALLRRRDVKNRICLGKRLVPSYGGAWFADDGWNEALAAIGDTDGYAIRFNRLEKPGLNCLHVFGTKAKGTMNGAFALLENNTDVIWARPNETLGTVFTPTNSLAFVWGDGVVSRPDTPSRGWNSYAWLEWASHNRCNLFNGGGGGDIEWTNPKKEAWGVFYRRHLGGHNIQHFFHGVTDKRCFPRGADDERLSDKFWYGNPCFTSSVCLENFVSNLLNCARMMMDGPGKLYVNTQDTWNGCQCPTCTAPIRLADGRVLTPDDDNFRSTQYWTFMNAAGRALAKEMPEMGIVSLAYFFTAPPPAVKLEPNVWPEFAPYVRANDKTTIDSPENRVWLDRLKGWYANCTKTIEIYDYYGLGLAFPRPLAEIRAKDFQLMNPYVLGHSSEVPNSADAPGKPAERIWDVSGMEYWVITRLYWDSRQDVEALRDYYVARTYREAAPEVGEIYRTIRREWFANPRASTLGDNATELAKIFIVKPGHADRFAALFAQALAKKDLHPKSRALVTRLRDTLMAFVEEAKNMKNPAMQWPIVQVKGALDWDSPAWEKAAAIDGFQKAFLKSREVPSDHPTRVRVFHDGRTLCVRAQMDDPQMSEKPKPQLPQGAREFIPEDDHLELFFTDPEDETRYYMFSLSPDGYASDLLGSDATWNCKWRRRARRTATGWEAIFEIPLASIHATNGDHNDLKFLILRQYKGHGGTKNEYSSWGGGIMHQTHTYGDVKIVR